MQLREPELQNCVQGTSNEIMRLVIGGAGGTFSVVEGCRKVWVQALGVCNPSQRFAKVIGSGGSFKGCN